MKDCSDSIWNKINFYIEKVVDNKKNQKKVKKIFDEVKNNNVLNQESWEKKIQTAKNNGYKPKIIIKKNI